MTRSQIANGFGILLNGHEPKRSINAQDSSFDNTPNEVYANSPTSLTDENVASSMPTGGQVSTESRETYSPNALTSEPSFGQKTRIYPLGYGYCQCGVDFGTQKHASGIYSMYFPGHQGKNNKQRVEGDLRFSELQHKYNLLS